MSKSALEAELALQIRALELPEPIREYQAIKGRKFRELLEEEKRLRNQLMDCETAQSRMLKKAFKNLGLKLGNFGDVVLDQSYIKVIEYTDCAVRFCRNTGVRVETCEISVEDLFDAEVK